MQNIILCSFLVLWYSSLAIPLYGSESSIEQGIWKNVIREYPALQGTPVALVVVATHNCAGCSALAINHAMEELRTREPRLPFVVAVIAEEALEATTVRERFFTPYVVADTVSAHRLYAVTSTANLPLFAVLDSAGNVLFRQEDIQHNQPNYAASIAGLVFPEEHARLSMPTEKQVHQLRAELLPDSNAILLEEPGTRSVRDIAPPVVAGGKLAALNYLTGALEYWDRATGRIAASFSVPDTAAYFYCQNRGDPRWKDIQKRGYEMSRFQSVTAVGDTVYALAKVLVGYNLKTTLQRDSTGNTDTVTGTQWHSGNVIVCWVDTVVQRIVPVPQKYSLIDITANDAGVVGGVCSTMFGADKSDGDSVVFFATVHAHKHPPTAGTVWKTPNTGGIVSAGAKAAAPNGALWYCDPMQHQFFLLHRDGGRTSIPLRGMLAQSASPIRFIPASSDAVQSDDAHTYALTTMLSVGDTLYVFLIPAAMPSSLPCIMQAYIPSGTFLGEWKVDIPSVHEATSIHLLAVQEGQATFVLNTLNKRWRVQNAPLGLDATSSLPLDIHRTAKP